MKAQKIALNSGEQAELSRQARSATISQHYARRARMILLAAQEVVRGKNSLA